MKLQHRWSMPLRFTAGVLVLALTGAAFVSSGAAAKTAALVSKMVAFLFHGTGFFHSVGMGLLWIAIGFLVGAVAKWLIDPCFRHWYKRRHEKDYTAIYRCGRSPKSRTFRSREEAKDAELTEGELGKLRLTFVYRAGTWQYQRMNKD